MPLQLYMVTLQYMALQLPMVSLQRPLQYMTLQL